MNAFTKAIFLVLIASTPFSVFAPAFSVFAEADHAHKDQEHDHDQHTHDEKDHGEHDHDHEEHNDQTEIESDMAARVGITTAVAGPGTIERQIQVFGRLVTPPGQSASLRARFPGVITDLRATVGDDVKRGEVLAVIESNESLQTYQLKAPLSGVVQQRSANIGELTDETPLFELLDTSKLWAELQVFPGQRDVVGTGQTVQLSHGDHEHEAQIESVVPTGSAKPYVLARVPLDNPLGHAVPGELISAKISVESIAAPLVVAIDAIQELESRIVVFVQEGNVYKAQPVRLGRSDGHYAEVLEGLHAGQPYVVNNSYLIKADIEKAGVAHEH